MNNIEILSPCGGMDSVKAAVRCGCDAIYVGLKSFSARANAKNFDLDELENCVKYCHERDVKVYLTVNTLVFDDEIEEALSLVKEAAKRDIDAVIVQDIGLSYLIKKAIPDLPLHGSTQMSVHTPYGAKALFEMGFKRVVLARELSKKEIEEIHSFCPEIELEVFVHGALCMSMSGQCLFSAMLGQRSANRGMCAQPCRLPFYLCDSKNALSLKDNSIINYFDELDSIGVTSAKIEGRMKRPEYVATATKACFEQKTFGFVSDKTKHDLSAVFARSGFTDGYFTGHRDKEMFGIRQKEDVISADTKLLKEIENSYKDEVQKIEIDFNFCVKQGEKAELNVSDGVHNITVFSDEKAEKAKKVSLSKERAEENLKKTGGTPYKVKNIEITIDDGIAFPISAVNKLRRNALEQLSQERQIHHNYKFVDYNLPTINTKKQTKISCRACTNDMNIPKNFADFEYIFINLDNIDIDKAKTLRKLGYHIGVEIPRAMFGREKEIIQKLKEVQNINIKDVLCHNIASVYFAKEMGFTVHAGFSMNFTNSFSLLWAKVYGIKDAELSLEIEQKDAEKLVKFIPTGLVTYGYLPLMLTRNCPVKGAGGNCSSCKKSAKLQDRKKEQFSVFCHENYVEILNCVPLILPEKIYKSQNPNFTVFHFTVENSVENKEKTLEKLSQNLKFERFTHGLYLRGVKGC